MTYAAASHVDGECHAALSALSSLVCLRSWGA
jgi:hypothetical protein